MIKYFLLSCLLSISFFQTKVDDWELKKSEDGIHVYSKEIQNSDFKAIKVTSVFDVRLSLIIAVFRDVPEYKNWVYGNAEAYVIKKINETEGIYYSKSDAPWPVSDREIVMKNTTIQDPRTRIITSTSESIKGYVDEHPDCVRLYSAKSLWVLKPINKNKTEVSYEITLDPGGYIPAWLANLTMDHGPIHTISKLKEQTKKEKYSNASFSHIQDF